MDFRGSDFFRNTLPRIKPPPLVALAGFGQSASGFWVPSSPDPFGAMLRQKETNFVVSISAGETLIQLIRPPFQLAEGV